MTISCFTPSRLRWQCLRTMMASLCLIGITGCAGRFEFPPMGERLPVSIKLEISPSIKALNAQYTDGCGHPIQVALGARLEDALVEGAYRTFTSVAYERKPRTDAAPEAVVRVDLADWSFELQPDAVSRQVPAHVHMRAIAQVADLKGTVLRKSELKIVRQEQVPREAVHESCDYMVDAFIRNTSVDFAATVLRDVRQAFGGTTAAAGPSAAAPSAPPPPTGTLPPPPTSTIRFKGMLLDENGNLILEEGEHIRVRVDVLNAGPAPIQHAVVSLSGSPALIRHFPSAILFLPTLQAGETKSVEFAATLPLSLQPMKADLRITVEDTASRAALPPQTLTVMMQTTGIKTDDVDQIPAAITAFRQPHTYLLSIGIGSYRDRQLLPRKFASLDAEMVANYFQALGGIPASNIRLLQDWKASRQDIDETLLNWLPPHMSNDAAVIVYFAGHAMTTANGEVLLVPYEGSPTASAHLYPLKDLETALARLNAKQTILLFDGVVSRLPGAPQTKNLAPRWDYPGSSTICIISSGHLNNSLEDEKHRHGLMTYYLLRALRGESDSNRDGSVTLGEVAGYVSQKVTWASISQFQTEQHPLISPAPKPNDPGFAFVLSKLAAIRSEQTP